MITFFDTVAKQYRKHVLLSHLGFYCSVLLPPALSQGEQISRKLANIT
jgi:hypothetical protein